MPQFSEHTLDFAYVFKNVTTRWYFYVIALFLIGLVVLSLFLLKNKGSRNKLSATQKIVYTAVMSAVCFVGNAFTIPASNLIQISFIALFGFVSGYMLGAGLGFTAAFIGDFLCAIIFPTGPYSPIINVGTALWGYVPGLLFQLFSKKKYLVTAISFVICFVLNSFAVNTLGLSLMYNMAFEPLMALLPFKLIVTAINAGLAFALVSVFERILPKDKFALSEKSKEENAPENDLQTENIKEIKEN